VKLLPRTLLAEPATRAAASPRRRAHHNIHLTPADVVQRFVLLARPDSYFRPHRHTGRCELAVPLQGCLSFDSHGRVTGRYSVGDGTDNLAYQTPPATWHTLVAGGGGAFLEIKQGPYDTATCRRPERRVAGGRQCFGRR
jgi:cupin fold WbuC family metalloprotein